MKDNLLQKFLAVARRTTAGPPNDELPRLWKQLQDTRIRRKLYSVPVLRAYVLALEKSRYYGSIAYPRFAAEQKSSG